MEDSRALPVRLIELGPGRGSLMEDILRTFDRFPTVRNSHLSVHLIENSENLKNVQKAKLEPFSRKNGDRISIQWHHHIQDIRDKTPMYTMVLAHEFFDAMPIHILEVGSRLHPL
ncbi:hypothetical protein BS47DRAFT_1403468 [Hydnum rufescens UP504]|uniref:Protein arginine methyltransferase NDUFAF7 n=1 Tax=Hydnum rufescens UP504 TaxID=1448309 RepID=A0A9P6DKP3_9AGAM|nr:hypothetical protein BS47DRAFT_1403468 [Hydnum rufescens UP504]